MPVTYSQTSDGGATHYVPGADTEGMQRVSRPGNGRWGRQRDPLHEARVASAAELMADVLAGRAPAWALKEAMAPTSTHTLRAIDQNYPHLVREGYSTSDFPYLMGDVLDRMMLDRFREFPQGWRRYIRVSRPLRDFRDVRRLALDGAEGQYSEQEEYEGVTYANTLGEANYTYAPSLYSLGVKLSWRAIMNDDLDAFDTIPDRLGRGGRRTIAKFATSLLFDANGPDATLFSSANGNIVKLGATSNPDLAIDALGAAFDTLLGLKDADGEPILVEGAVLIYPPALHVTVQNLMNQLTVDYPGVAPGVDGDITVRVNNWIVRNLEAVMDPYIPVIATTNGATSWILASRPNSGRPIAEIGFLAGYEEPQLFRKAPNAARVGGGLDEMHGDFESMAHHYKGVIAFGGTAMEPKAAVASNGSNS